MICFHTGDRSLRRRRPCPTPPPEDDAHRSEDGNEEEGGEAAERRRRRRKRTKGEERENKPTTTQLPAEDAGSDEDVEDEEDGRGVVVVDVCSGKGFAATLLSFLLPRGARVLMADANGDMELSHVAARPNVSFAHVDVFAPSCLTAIRAALDASQRDLDDQDDGQDRPPEGCSTGSAPRPRSSSSSSSVVSECVLVGVHLCEASRQRLLDLAVGLAPRCRGLVLCPCCLRGALGRDASAPPGKAASRPRSSSGGCGSTPAVALLPCLSLPQRLATRLLLLRRRLLLLPLLLLLLLLLLPKRQRRRLTKCSWPRSETATTAMDGAIVQVTYDPAVLSPKRLLTVIKKQHEERRHTPRPDKWS